MSTLKSLDELQSTPHANVFPTDEPKTIRLTLAEGEQLHRHTHPDREIVLYLIAGELELRLGEKTYDVESGDVVHFDGAQDISGSAVANSTALLVLARKVDQ